METFMKLLIDHKKISNSPCENIIDNNDEDIILQLKQQLLYGNPTCILVSGYRGTGKTSLICKLERALTENPEVLFVHLNFNKYEKYTLVLRKLIREIYLSFIKKNNYQQIKKNNSEKIKLLELLYEKTFFEIIHSTNIKKTTDYENTSEVSINDVKKFAGIIGSFFSFLVTSLNLSYNFISLIPIYFNKILLIISILWVLFEFVKIGIKVIKKTSNSDEINRKSLYDDEIAETHIKEILTDLKKIKIKTIFVLDELDKIENEIEIEQLVSELKPIMLSDLASFLIVSGQKLYYKFTSSSTIDDSLISSIFSKLVHIPLLNKSSFENIFKSLVQDKNLCSEPQYKFYVDSLILNSNRTVRKFYNLISQDIIWEEGKAYLPIYNDNLKIFETDSKLLAILEKIEQDQIEIMEYVEGIKDFFVIQLYIWIQKVKLKGKIYFSKEEIYNFEKDYSQLYPAWCNTHLNMLCNVLLENMVEENLLEKKQEELDEEKIDYFRWTEQANIKLENTLINDDIIKSQFLMNMIEFEKNSRDLYIDLIDKYSKEYINKYNDKEIINRMSLKQLLSQLIKIEVYDNSFLNKINDLIEISNNIRHGKDIDNFDIYNILDNFSFKSLIYNSFERYTYFVANKFLTAIGYKLKWKDSKGYDFLAVNSDLQKCDIIFEVKYKNQSSSNEILKSINKMIEVLKQYNLDTDKNNKLVIFWYSNEGRILFEKFFNNFHKILSTKYPELKQFVYLYYASEYRSHFCATRLEEYLKKVIDND